MDTKDKLLTVNGIIISEKDYKDYDKLLTILTKELGIILVYAFSVRRINSKNIGKTNLFTFGTYEIRKHLDRYRLESVAYVIDFSDTLKDYNINCYASYFIELASYFCVENEDESDIVLLLYYTFLAMKKGKVDIKLIRRIFELKMYKYQGQYIDSNDLKTDDETFKFTWDFILKSKPESLYSFNLSDKVYEKLDREVERLNNGNVQKKFKSLSLLESL